MGVYMTRDEMTALWRNRNMSEAQMIQCLAELNGCEYREARDACEKYGLIEEGAFTRKMTYRNWSADERKELIRMVQMGKSVTEIAQILGRTVQAIYHQASRVGLNVNGNY